MRTSEPLMAAKKPNCAELKTLMEEWEVRVTLQVFKSTISWWRLLHVSTEIFIKLWVESYSSPALSGRTILLPIIQCFNTNDKVGNISLLCWIAWKSTHWYNHILYSTNNTFWYKFNSLYVLFANTTINPLWKHIINYYHLHWITLNSIIGKWIYWRSILNFRPSTYSQ